MAPATKGTYLNECEEDATTLNLAVRIAALTLRGVGRSDLSTRARFLRIHATGNRQGAQLGDAHKVRGAIWGSTVKVRGAIANGLRLVRLNPLISLA